MRVFSPAAVRIATLVSLAGASVCSSSLADVKLPAILSDHMVLQQSSAVPIWGWADPGEQVKVKASWSGEEQSAIAKPDGSWRVLIKTPAAADAERGLQAGATLSLTITGKNSITLKDLLIGEVWLCSGQSNMEWPLAASDNSQQAIADAIHPRIRFFTVKNAVAAAPQKDCVGQWAACKPETAQNFSAVGYYFGLALQRELKIPIGLIASDWGGTPAEAWTSEQTIRLFPELSEHLAHNERIRKRDAAVALDANTKGIDPDFAAWLAKLDELDVGSHDPKADAAGGWYADKFDDSKWPAAAVPGHWTGDLANFDGFVWMRTRTPLIQAVHAGQPAVLSLPPIDDCDTIWINGIKIGESMTGEAFNTPRTYAIPAGVLRAGPNSLAIRVLDTGGPGGISGDAALCKLTVNVANAAPTVYSLAGQWKIMRGAAVAQLPKRPAVLSPQPYISSNLYNAMIAPIAGYGLRGAIWYQGESNRDRAFQYRTLFPAMITDWRNQWATANAAPVDNKAFPFYYVQIAPFRYGGDVGQTSELREAQTLAMNLPNTGMAVTMDIGNVDDIHPTNKAEVGRRLSLWALARTYGRSDIVYSGPLYRSMKIENNRIHLSFDHAEGGLISTAGKANHSVTSRSPAKTASSSPRRRRSKTAR